MKSKSTGTLPRSIEAFAQQSKDSMIIGPDLQVVDQTDRLAGAIEEIGCAVTELTARLSALLTNNAPTAVTGDAPKKELCYYAENLYAMRMRLNSIRSEVEYCIQNLQI